MQRIVTVFNYDNRNHAVLKVILPKKIILNNFQHYPAFVLLYLNMVSNKGAIYLEEDKKENSNVMEMLTK